MEGAPYRRTDDDNTVTLTANHKALLIEGGQLIRYVRLHFQRTFPDVDPDPPVRFLPVAIDQRQLRARGFSHIFHQHTGRFLRLNISVRADDDDGSGFAVIDYGQT